MTLPHYGHVKSVFRTLSLEDSLIHIWAMSMHISRGIPLPYGYEDVAGRGSRDLKSYLFPHQLDLMLRETVLHAGYGAVSRSLLRWDDLAAAVNCINNYGNSVFDEGESDALMLTMHRCAHQQFNISNPLDKQKIGRYLALYRFEPLAKIFERRLGIGVDEYFILAFGVLAGFLSRPRLNASTDFSVLGSSRSASSAFFSRLIGSYPTLRSSLIASQNLGSCWEYTRNAIHFRPLINVDVRNPDRVYCPMPALLEQRLYAGVFYDIVEDTEEFSKAYGSGFEDLVGRVLKCAPEQLAVVKPPVYFLGKRRMDGVDWLVSDEGSHLFIECKTKRITAAAKTAETTAAIASQVDVLAKAIFQNYKNIGDALDGAWELEHQGKNIYSLVVTLEDWHLFSPIATDSLRLLVADRLVSAGLPDTLLQQVPYLICSIEELECLIAVLQSHTIDEVLAGLFADEFRGWTLGTYLNRAFPEGTRRKRVEFYTDFEEVVNKVVGKFREAT